MIAVSCCIVAAVVGSDSWVVESIPAPDGEVVEVGGIAFPDDDTIAVSTRRGRVWLIDGALDEHPSDASWTMFADGLYEGLGLDTQGDDLVVLQRGELSLLQDQDGDRQVDAIKLISDGWGLSDNYHEFAFGLPRDSEGNRFVSLNLGFMSPEWWHGKAVVPYRGYILKVAPDGEVTPWAHGFRSPCGLGFDAEGRLLATDNQGDWMPSSPIFVVQRDGFHGHPASLRWTEEYLESGREPDDKVPPTVARVPAAIWIPYDWSRSTGNVVADMTGGAFGPFEGQLFVAELTTGRVLRAEIEQIEGVFQGAVWPFVDRVGSVARVAFASDGSLICGLTNRGWGGMTPGSGVRRIRFTGNVPLEMKHVRLVPGGFDIEFTHPLRGEVSPDQIHVDTYDYNWWWKYGSPEQRRSGVRVTSTSLSADGKTLHLSVPMLRAGRVARIRLSDVWSRSGDALAHNEVAYTINVMPGGAVREVAKEVDPPSEDASIEDDSGWLRLTWGDARDLWDGHWRLGDAELDREDRTRFVQRPGVELLASDETNDELVLRGATPDGLVTVAVMLPKGGAIAMGLPGNAKLIVKDAAKGGSIEVIGPDGMVLAAANRDLWRGPGQWHRLEVKVDDRLLSRVAIDDMAIMDEVVLPDGGHPQWLRFFPSPGPGGIADVRLKPDRIKVLDRGDNPLKGTFEVSGDLSVMVGDHGMQLYGTGSLALRKSLPRSFELRGTMQFTADSVATLRLGETEIVIGESDGANHATGSIIGVDDRTVAAIPSDGWCDFGIEVHDGIVRVMLNQLVVSEGVASPEGALAIHMQSGRMRLTGVRLTSPL